MTFGPDLEQRLDDWMQEDALLPDDLDEVITKLPQTPQRRYRWSLTTTELTGRTRSMFNATRIAAFVAIFALGASSALVLAPRSGPADPVVPPAAEAPTLDDMARVTWRGWRSGDDPSRGTVASSQFGELIEGAWAQFDIDASDERLSGTATYTIDLRYMEPTGDAYPASIMVGTVVLEAADGTWEGSFVGTDYPGTPDEESQAILTGTGAYEGLSAVMTTLNSKTSGLIFPGELPGAP